MLRNHLAGGRDAQPGATRTSFPNQIAAVSAPHLRRCLQAGLCRAVGGRNGSIELTDAGKSLLGIRD